MIFEHLETSGQVTSTIDLKISTEVVHLLSDQLYQSPLKALEELVINAYDAGAKICRLFVPSPSEQGEEHGRKFIAVFDNGSGLTDEGMVDLWHLGRSNKRTEEVQRRSSRKLIGKFGIGKLATYTVASKLTYISKTANGITSATLNFDALTGGASGVGQPVPIPLRHLSNWNDFAKSSQVQKLIEALGVMSSELASTSWTFVILESLKVKAKQIKLGSLGWVLKTAMPLRTDFALYLNGDEIRSNREDYEKAVEFTITSLPDTRLAALSKKTGENWHKQGQALFSDSFLQGVSGSVMVTQKTLPGKSDDLLRSNGFFIRVLGRLISQDEPFFGMTHLHYGTLNRFRADIEADDLDIIITAPRESVGTSQLKERFEALLLEIFQEARQRYDDFLEKQAQKEEAKKEHLRNFISPTLVEHSIATALLNNPTVTAGAEADNSWFYFSFSPDANLPDLIKQLYSHDRRQFVYKYTGAGRPARLVSFDPLTSTFVINADHEFAEAHSDDPRSRLMLEDIVLAEALLEAQLRNARVPPHVIGEVLQDRDSLLRGLALDHPYSSHAIAKSLLDSAADEHNLEIALVAAARSLGFVAKHISGSGEPDGIARFVDYPQRETSITLEAKSSASVPSLSAIDFAGLNEHMINSKCQGCLLVAPDYPNVTSDDAAAANRARQLKISCWTVEQLARLIESAESRHITAKQVLTVVLSNFAPQDVSTAIGKMFAEPMWDQHVLGQAIIKALRRLEGKLRDRPRSVEFVATLLTETAMFEKIEAEDVRQAIVNLAAASQGALRLEGEQLVLLTSYDELERRVASQTGNGGVPLRTSKLRSDLGGKQ
jgi:hypothetical protein